MLTIEKNDEEGYFMLLDDGIGMCKSKSRNVLVRVRDALNALANTGLVGHTVDNRYDSMETRVNGFPRGVVLAHASNGIVVRLPDGQLDVWEIGTGKIFIIEPTHPKSTAEWHDPAIGAGPAVALLQCWLQLSPTSEPEEVAAVAAATRKFIEMREAAQPSNF